jgi:hypothetical protein
MELFRKPAWCSGCASVSTESPVGLMSLRAMTRMERGRPAPTAETFHWTLLWLDRSVKRSHFVALMWVMAQKCKPSETS